MSDRRDKSSALFKPKAGRDEAWGVTGSLLVLASVSPSAGDWDQNGVTQGTRRPVRAAHFLRLRTMTSSQVGTERSDVWFADGTGRPLDDRRTIVVRTDTAFSRPTYAETGNWMLRSLTPARSPGSSDGGHLVGQGPPHLFGPDLGPGAPHQVGGAVLRADLSRVVEQPDHGHPSGHRYLGRVVVGPEDLVP